MRASKKSRRSKIAVWSAAALLVAAFLGLFTYFGQAAMDAREWPSVQGRVLLSEVKVGCGRGGNQYYPDVLYSYQFKGRRYEGRAVALDTDNCGWASNAEDVVARYPVGETVTVYVDPSRPSHSALAVGELQSTTTSLVFLLSIGLVASVARIGWLLKSAA
jgi:hypothetical protein